MLVTLYFYLKTLTGKHACFIVCFKLGSYNLPIHLATMKCTTFEPTAS